MCVCVYRDVIVAAVMHECVFALLLCVLVAVVVVVAIVACLPARRAALPLPQLA